MSSQLLVTLNGYVNSISFSGESKRTAECILQELICQYPERALSILGSRSVNRYLPMNVQNSPSQRQGKIARQENRSPPLSCAT